VIRIRGKIHYRGFLKLFGLMKTKHNIVHLNKIYILIISSLLLLPSCVHTDVDVNGGISGFVKDKITSQQISGCSISLTPGNNQVYSSENGAYQFTGLEMGDYTLIATKKGYCKLTTILTISSGKNLSFDIILSPATLPSVSTDSVTNILASTATIFGTINNNGGTAISEKGFYYGIDSLNLNKVFVTDTFSVLCYNLVDLIDGAKYYYQTFAKNEAGEGKGELKIFTTHELYQPIVNTLPHSSVGTKTVTLNGEITDRGYCNILSCGFYLGMTTNPNQKYTYPSNDSNLLSLNIKNLHSNSTYYYCTFAENIKGETKGEVLTFKTLDTSKPIVQTNEASNIAPSSATLNANIIDDGGCEITEYGFYAGTSQQNLTKLKSTNISGNAFSCLFGNLQAETNYYYKSYAKNEKGENVGELLSFKTSKYNLPIVRTIEASNILSNTAILNGLIEKQGDANIIICGFYYGQDINNLKKVTLSSVQNNFSYSALDLLDGTTYYFKAFATNTYGEGDGETLSFKTSTLNVPSITTISASNINYTSATFLGNIDSDGGAEILECGFYYGTTSTPSTKVVASKTGTSFQYNINGLSEGTTYYYQSFAKNSKGEAKGQVLNFKTKIDLAPSVSTDNITNISCIGAQLNGTIINTNDNPIIDCGFYYGTSTSSMTKVSTGTSSSTSFSQKIASLKINTTYFVKAYAVSSVGEGFGNIVSFNTSRASYKVGSQEYEFAHGNLQYNDITRTYSFASSQYEYIGTNNLYHTNGGIAWACVTDLFSYTIATQSIFINNDTWKCLSKSDWDYICSGRDNAINKMALATICTIPGLLILPDNWELPEGIPSIILNVRQYNSNIFDQSQWTILENAGAVFLPAAGYLVSLSTNGIKGIGDKGTYWSTDYSGYVLYFPSVVGYSYISTTQLDKNYYKPIRPVKVVNK